MADSYYRMKSYDGVSDFCMWSVRMKGVLVKEKVWHAVDESDPSTLSAEERKEMDLQAHSEIMMRLTDEVGRQVLVHTTAKTLWTALKELYEVKSLPSRVSLLCRLFTFKMNTNLSLQDNLDSFLRMTQDLERCKDPIDEVH